MTTLEHYPFLKTTSAPAAPICVCVVVIQTINSGKIRRYEYTSWDEARAFAEGWRRKNHRKLTYKVSVEAL